MNTESRDRFVADFRRVVTALPGAREPWVSRARHAALDRFAASGLPTLKDEDWKYTSLALLEKQTFLALPGGAADCLVTPAQVAALAPDGLQGHLLVFVDGRHHRGLSRLGSLPAGVAVASLADALESTPAALEEFLLDGTHHTILGELNTAFMSDGAWIHVPRGVEVVEPIHLLFIATAQGAAIHPRNLIVAEEGAHATVIEHYADPDGVASFTNAVTRIVVGRDAAIEHCKLNRQAPEAIHIAGIHAAQGRMSRLASHSVSLGGSLARTDITSSLDAEGAIAELNGLYLAGGRQRVDHHTRIDHARPGGTSREHYRGILDGASRGVFNGRVVVHPGAQRTDAHQANDNLLLSRDAEIDTKPQLEIYADDVKCTHGATVGQLDEAQVFYLRSRGLKDAVARSVLTQAFARDTIERVRAAPLRAYLDGLLVARLPGAMAFGAYA